MNKRLLVVGLILLILLSLDLIIGLSSEYNIEAFKASLLLTSIVFSVPAIIILTSLRKIKENLLMVAFAFFIAFFIVHLAGLIAFTNTDLFSSIMAGVGLYIIFGYAFFSILKGEIDISGGRRALGGRYTYTRGDVNYYFFIAVFIGGGLFVSYQLIADNLDNPGMVINSFLIFIALSLLTLIIYLASGKEQRKRLLGLKKPGF